MLFLIRNEGPHQYHLHFHAIFIYQIIDFYDILVEFIINMFIRILFEIKGQNLHLIFSIE